MSSVATYSFTSILDEIKDRINYYNEGEDSERH